MQPNTVRHVLAGTFSFHKMLEYIQNLQRSMRFWRAQFPCETKMARRDFSTFFSNNDSASRL